MHVKFDLSLIPRQPDLSFETQLWQQAIYPVAGIDEAGRGALAGPVAAGVVVLPPEASIAAQLDGVRDSKQMSPAERRYWADRLPALVQAWAVGFATHQEIDELGIVPAVRLAVARALACLESPPAHLLVDYLDLPDCPIPQTALVKGDARSLSIAAASVLAKTARDARMVELDALHPGYGFTRHKGYGTLAHRQAIRRLGSSPIHRLTFQVKDPGPALVEVED